MHNAVPRMIILSIHFFSSTSSPHGSNLWTDLKVEDFLTGIHSKPKQGQIQMWFDFLF